MRTTWDRIKRPFIKRKYWIRQISVAAVASATAWVIGDRLITNGGLVAAIVCALSIRVSLYKSVREGLGQIIGTAIGAGIALLAVSIFKFGFIAIGLTVLMSAVVARALHLGEVASVNVPVTALIVLGPGLSESTALHRFSSTVLGALIAIGFSYWSHPKTPAGRTRDKIKRIGRSAANLLATMADGVAKGYSQNKAGDWLTSAREMIEEIPALRSQALEAKRYARWSPIQEGDIADELYLRAVALEHIVVQVRTIARTLFDLAVDGDINLEPNRQVATALSSASHAILANTEIEDGVNSEIVTVGIANDLRAACSNLAAEIIEARNELTQEALVKEISIVSNIERIADSIDESSPALSDVSTPDEPLTQKVMQVSPIDQTTKLSRRIWRAGRKFLRR
ncbi:MAG: hypothetical protein RL301_36 [Actinomycetota bacterium]|jgi:uncharacterized membrane protein YgaE (UPF0421/DUF939 family)